MSNSGFIGHASKVAIAIATIWPDIVFLVCPLVLLADLLGDSVRIDAGEGVDVGYEAAGSEKGIASWGWVGNKDKKLLKSKKYSIPAIWWTLRLPFKKIQKYLKYYTW